MSDYDQIDNMSREQLLSELQNIPYWAYLTALPTEMCFEVVVFTRKGCSSSWIGYDDWTLVMLEPIEKDIWHNLVEKVMHKNLLLEDLEGTELYKVAKNYNSACLDEENVSWLFSEIEKIGESIGDGWFCYWDSDNEKDILHFFIHEEDVVNHLAEHTVINTEWTSMTDEELKDCLELYNYAGPTIPFITFS